jgi:hypothetical protein
MSGNNTMEPAHQNEDVGGDGLIPTVDHKLWPSCFPEPSSGRPAFDPSNDK